METKESLEKTIERAKGYHPFKITRCYAPSITQKPSKRYVINWLGLALVAHMDRVTIERLVRENSSIDIFLQEVTKKIPIKSLIAIVSHDTMNQSKGIMLHAYVIYFQNDIWNRIDDMDKDPTPLNSEDWYWYQNCEEIYFYEWVEQCETHFANQVTCAGFSLVGFCNNNDITVPEEIPHSTGKAKRCTRCSLN